VALGTQNTEEEYYDEEDDMGEAGNNEASPDYDFRDFADDDKKQKPVLVQKPEEAHH
jgi:hypothetical protein